MTLRFPVASVLALAIAGCAAMPAGAPSGEPMPAPLARLSATAEGLDGARKHLALGLRELYEGRLDAAGSHFNMGLKLDPQNANLNFLGALTYHARAAGGDQAQGELAEVGYRLALKFDPGHWLAAYQLGRLCWERRRYGDAQDAFALALLAEPDNARAAYGLAAASYAAGDPLTARIALDRLPVAVAARAEVRRTRALVLAALGEGAAARQELDAYRAAGASPDEARHAMRRVAAWGAVYGAGDRLAQIAPPPVPAGPSLPPGPGVPPGPGIAPGYGPVPPGASMPSTRRGMVIVDAVIIEREDSMSTSNGVNLLAGLSLQFGGSILDYSRTRVRDKALGTLPFSEERAVTQVAVTLPAVTYSLNIANAQDSANRIVARPSVLAYDGQASEMFIGSELTFTAAGTFSGTSYTKEVGLSLQVTPRFQADGRLLLAVKTEFGTFAPTAAPGTFKEALATVKSRSSVTAEMAMGQTVVVAAGASSRESDLRDGVPVLRDTPLLQYLFSTRNRVKQETSLLILLTPRLPATPESMAGVVAGGGQAGAPGPASPALRELKRRHGAWWAPTSNVLKAMDHLRALDVYDEFRRGDVQFVDLAEGGRADTPTDKRLQGVLRDLMQLIYF